MRTAICMVFGKCERHDAARIKTLSRNEKPNVLKLPPGSHL